jgi:hypothetical protein
VILTPVARDGIGDGRRRRQQPALADAFGPVQARPVSVLDQDAVESSGRSPIAGTRYTTVNIATTRKETDTDARRQP